MATFEQRPNGVRALSAGDGLDYRKRTTELITQARLDAGLALLADDDDDDSPLPVGFSAAALNAFVLIRILPTQCTEMIAYRRCALLSSTVEVIRRNARTRGPFSVRACPHTSSAGCYLKT
ncbi:hypothetical protein NJC40_03290 [Pseudomonas sp. 21LCFQ02]|uniref:hypothetical protein n=1 Tax=Pseudomonas sp. 21LCFQ02 TaxID=2957505 RepID=UPI00209AE95C|nr:hypothetical protein [Pseudomonas sp. 21LCFQ02]MCO8166801.1 hypothetical protein [Pseudomonas sp. 21LCFQ02]